MQASNSMQADLSTGRQDNACAIVQDLALPETARTGGSMQTCLSTVGLLHGCVS